VTIEKYMAVVRASTCRGAPDTAWRQVVRYWLAKSYRGNAARYTLRSIGPELVSSARDEPRHTG